MRRIFFFSVLALVLCLTAGAEQLSPEAALARMNGSRMKVAGAGKGRMRLVQTAQEHDTKLFYVFRNEVDGQSVILGADDVLPAVMAYGISAYDADNVPAQMRDWFDYYKRVCSRAVAQRRSLPAAIKGERVGPLLSSMWDQENPYNIICIEKTQKNVPVGCVATAMAQIMYYWKYPLKGKGQHSYASPTGTSLSADFGATTYDWAHIKDYYGAHAVEGKSDVVSEQYTDEEARAVALLMYHCGVSVDMEYNEAGSGSANVQAASSMIKYFGYDRGARLLFRDVYSDEEWQQIILDDLVQKRPVLYGGYTRNDEGHSFVCDGFDGNGYFHFNWGWSGMGNGYYLVVGDDPLHPKYQGAGGSLNMDAFDQRQEIVVGLQPAQAGSQYADMSVSSTAVVECSQGKTSAILCTSPNVEVTGNVMRGSSYYLCGQFMVASLVPFSADFGVIMRNVDTGDEYPCLAGGVRSQRVRDNIYISYPIKLDCVPKNGTYEVYPAYLPFGPKGEPRSEWRKMDTAVGTTPYRVTLTGTLPQFTITNVELSKENGQVTADPKVTVSLKALASVSKKKLSCSIYDWTGSKLMGTCTVSTSLTIKKGDEKTFADLSFRMTTPLKEGQVYKLTINSRGYEYELGNVNYTNLYFCVGDEGLVPVEQIPVEEASRGKAGCYYNLQGQPVARPTHGIYILNGKKVLVK